jgi:hypothetical protein
MKTVLCLALLCVGQLAAFASETAYNALRVIGKQNGADALNKVVEVRGRAGAPVPASWKVVLHDPTARGGLREYEVQAGKIVSERTPTARATGTPINFNQLNLDSEGAYTVADQEARRAKIPFERVDYTLQAGSAGPVWHLELFGAGDKVGSIDVAADSGTIVRRELTRQGEPPVEERYTRENRPPPPPRDLPPRPDAVDPREPRDRVAEEDRRARDRDYYYDDDEEYVRRRERVHQPFPDRVQHHFERRASQIKRFFLGDD